METKIIDELLEDKQQIVTYKYLISKLNIHPNKAKQLLKDYVSKLPDDKKYSTTIAIGGTFKENDEYCVVLAYDDHVETMRRRFKHIDFEHLYSIQPISRFDDINNALYLADSSLNNVSLPSSIDRKEERNISVPKQCVETEKDIDLPSTKVTNDTSNKVLNNYSIETKVENKTKSDKTQKKTGVDFFAKNTKNNNSKLEVTEKKMSPKKVSPKKVSSKIVSPIKSNSDFFTKFKKSNNVDLPTATPKNEVLVENIIKDNRKMDVELSKKNVLENVPNEEKNAKKPKKRKNSENKNKKKNSQKVKRKRIQTFDSSDEEVDSEEEDKKRSEHAMDVEEEIDIVQPTPPRPTPRENKKKEKQTTTSTFIDDDGFVCTTKEVKIVETECEPLSESVENLEPKQLNTEPATKKMKSCQPDTAVQVDKKKGKTKASKNISNQGMKQSSLTSFFKTK